MPTELSTLGVIHLATALLWRERATAELVMATHDAAHATAARAFGLRAVGVWAGAGRRPTQAGPLRS